MKIPNWYIRDGRFTTFGGGLTLVFGIGFALLSVAFMPFVWLRYTGLVIGLTIAAIAGYEGKAHGLGLPAPFTRDPLGWRKVKAENKAKEDAENKVKQEAEKDADKK